MSTPSRGHATQSIHASEQTVSKHRTLLTFLLTVIALTLANPSALAAESMTLRADLTEAPRGLIRGSLSLTVKPGPLTLVYPQWIPGYHGPVGPITDLSG